ncbi:MAG: hypothetical protein RJB01_1215 [Actinomycetota bacterium]|jgi:hypothetical protein
MGSVNALWWLYAVVLGAALANTTITLTLAVKSRLVTGSRVHVPTVLWGLFFALLSMQAWIASVGYQASLAEVTVLEALALLWVPLSILASSVLLGEHWWGSSTDESPSAAEQFPRVITAVLWVFLVMVIVNEVLRASRGDLVVDIDLFFPGAMALVAACGIVIPRWRDGWPLPGLMLVLLTSYTALGYSTVGVSPAGI